jgi:hypothetical protein
MRMSIETTLGDFFKGETRSSGARLFKQEKVALGSHSDTAIEAFVRVSPSAKVALKTPDIGSESLSASCSCSSGMKGQACKHVWAVLLATEERYPDFLSAKRCLEKMEATRAEAKAVRPESAYQASAKLRAKEYRKEQAERQKARVKQLKQERKGRESLAERGAFPEAVEAALAYFDANGFPMPAGPADEVLAEAKKRLSRVFHPDRGGSHEEIVELNRNCEVLLRFMRE